jgi:hypothetical protein
MNAHAYTAPNAERKSGRDIIDTSPDLAFFVRTTAQQCVRTVIERGRVAQSSHVGMDISTHSTASIEVAKATCPVDRPHEWASSCASSRERFSSSTSPVRAWRAGWSGPARAPIAVRPAVALASQRALRRPASHRCGTHPRLASKQAPRPKAKGRTAPTGAYGARSNRAFDCRPRAIRERFADGARVQVEEVADGSALVRSSTGDTRGGALMKLPRHSQI